MNLEKIDLDRFWSKVTKDGFTVREELGPCWLWLAGRGCGGRYGSIGIDRRLFSTHRLSYEINVGPIPKGMCVLHKCDVTLCVRPEHLFLGTQLENVRDRNAKGRTARGERQGMRRLTVDAVRQIRSRHADGISQAALARSFRVSQGTIWAILNGKTWCWLDPEGEQQSSRSEEVATAHTGS